MTCFRLAGSQYLLGKDFGHLADSVLVLIFVQQIRDTAGQCVLPAIRLALCQCLPASWYFADCIHCLLDLAAMS
jgi:hypothetical protein